MKLLTIRDCTMVFKFTFLKKLSKSKIENCIEFYSTKNDNCILQGDPNYEPSELVIRDFMENYSFITLINNPTCFKSHDSKFI